MVTMPLSIDGLCAQYGERTVLTDVSLEVPKANITVVLGGSGCGKSTLLRHAVGLATPSRGSVALFGQPLADADETALAGLRRRIGVLFQSGALLGDLNVRDNVMLPMRMLADWPAEVCWQIAQTKLAWLGMGDAADLWPNELSGGMRKRAALARALALEPELLFCDEPSAGLDPTTAAELDVLLLRTRDTFGTSMLVVSHELASIDALADSVVMLGGGRVLQTGSLAEVRASPQPEIQDFFGRRRRQAPGTLQQGGHGGASSLLAAIGGGTPEGH